MTTLLKIAVSATLLYILIINTDTEALIQVVKSIPPIYVVVLAGLFVFIQVLSAYRWSIVLKKDMEVPYHRVFSIFLVGTFFNNFLPTVVGGDVIKGYYLYKISGNGEQAFASILIDRYSGFTALMAITLVGLAAGYTLIAGTGLGVFFLLLLGFFVTASLFMWVDWLNLWLRKLLSRVGLYGINEKVENFYSSLKSYATSYAILVKIFFLSVVIQTTFILCYVILGRGLGMEVPVEYFFLFVPLATAISMVPVSLAGLGIREGAFVFLFAQGGASTEEALLLSLLWFGIMVAVSTVGGVEYIRLGGRRELAEPAVK